MTINIKNSYINIQWLNRIRKTNEYSMIMGTYRFYLPWSSHVFFVTEDPSLFRPNTLKQPCLNPIPLKFLSRPISTLAKLDLPTPEDEINMMLYLTHRINWNLKSLIC